MKPLSFKDSFKNALRGVICALSSERNLRIHFIAFGSVMFLGWICNLSAFEFIALIMAGSLVIITELINTAIEKTVDLCVQDYHPLAKAAKDIAAGAVLLAALNAVLIGWLLFAGHVQKIFFWLIK
ncbi:diacylglycerol kinase family protein [Bacillota bacterium LX-D]|nr:diacylglycerol kinase family protein [Bacillota bacterium LX-D]